MNILKLAVLASAFLGPMAVAQEAHPWNGTWTTKLASEKVGAELEGTVVVKDDGGSWKTLARQRSDPCIGREAPLTVQRASSDELVFLVTRSKVLTGCTDFKVTLKRVDDNKLEGTYGSRSVVMTRN